MSAIISTVQIFYTLRIKKKLGKNDLFTFYTSGFLLLVFFSLPPQKFSCRRFIVEYYVPNIRTKEKNVRICIKMNFLVRAKQCGLSFSFHRCRSFIKRKIHILHHIMLDTHTITLALTFKLT